MARVMRGHAAAHNRLPVTMRANLGVFFCETLQDGAAAFAALGLRVAARERGFRRSLITAPARRQKNNRWQKIVGAERGQKLAGRHLRHVELQRGGPPRRERHVRR